MKAGGGAAVLVLETPEMAALPPSKSEQIRNVFVPMADMLKEFEGDYAQIAQEALFEITPELSARARRLRLDIAKVRIGAEHARKTLKEEYLLAGKAIDGTNNILKWAISQKEEALESIEKHAERAEASRVAALQVERVEALLPFTEDAAARDLGSLDADVWDAYLAAAKGARARRDAAERGAEEERAARAATERAEKAALKVERDRLFREAQDTALAFAESERARRELLEAESERLAKEERAAAIKAADEATAANAPARKRLLDWVDSFALPEFPGEDHDVAVRIRGRFEMYRKWARAEIEQGLS